jgi:hypothetical protein
VSGRTRPDRPPDAILNVAAASDADIRAFAEHLRALPPRDAPSMPERSPAELLREYVRILAALRSRGLIRTGKVVGDYAEALVCRALVLDPANGPVQGYDAIDPSTQLRYQIKARRIGPKWKDVGMGPFRGLDQDLFDVFVGVVFDQDFRVVRAVSVPQALVMLLAHAVSYDQTHRLNVGPGLLLQPGVTDLTESLRSVADAWT